MRRRGCGRGVVDVDVESWSRGLCRLDSGLSSAVPLPCPWTDMRTSAVVQRCLGWCRCPVAAVVQLGRSAGLLVPPIMLSCAVSSRDV